MQAFRGARCRGGPERPALAGREVDGGGRYDDPVTALPLGLVERSVRPLALVFYPPVWLLVAWCELRADFRNFRLDRCASLTVADRRFLDEPGKTLADFLRRMAADEAERASA